MNNTLEPPDAPDEEPAGSDAVLGPMGTAAIDVTLAAWRTPYNEDETAYWTDHLDDVDLHLDAVTRRFLSATADLIDAGRADHRIGYPAVLECAFAFLESLPEPEDEDAALGDSRLSADDEAALLAGNGDRPTGVAE